MPLGNTEQSKKEIQLALWELKFNNFEFITILDSSIKLGKEAINTLNLNKISEKFDYEKDSKKLS